MKALQVLRDSLPRRNQTAKKAPKMENDIIAEVQLCQPGQHTGGIKIQPDVGKAVQLSEEQTRPPVIAEQSEDGTTPETEAKPRKKRNKRGRPPMTKAAKKAAKVAKKAKAAPLAAKKEAVKSTMPMSKMSPAVEQRVNEFEPREGTIRKRLLIALCSSVNKPLREADLQMTLYAAITPETKSALGMVLKGVAAMIAARKLKYTLERDKNGDGETTIVLRSK